MKVALIIAPKDFKDETLAKACGMLNRWKVETALASLSARGCTGAHGAEYNASCQIKELRPGELDAILVVDGEGFESFKLYDHMPLLDLMRELSSRGKVVAGIGVGVKAIAKANIVSGKKIAVRKNTEAERMVRLYKGVPSDEEIEAGSSIMSLSNSQRTEEFVGLMLDRLGVR